MINQFDEFLGAIDVSEGDLRPKKKEKKQKQFVKNFFLVNKRRRVRKEPSEVSRITSELIKKNLTKPEEIQNYFNINFKTVTKQNQALYQALVGSRVLNGNIRISDVLTNRPVYEYFSYSGLKTKTICNDSLYLSSLLSNFMRLGNSSIFNQNCVRYGKIDKVIFCSIPFKCDGNIKKGYYQDYSGSFAAVGMEGLSDEERAAILSGNEAKVNFYIGDEEYTSYGNNNACVIAKSTTTLNDLGKYFNAMKVINVSNKIGLSEKVVEVDNKVRYIDSKVSPEKFCPAFLITPVQVSYSVFFRVALDYNKIFTDMENELNKNNKMTVPMNLFYWTSMQQCFDFLGVFSVTAKIVADNKTLINNIYTKYNELKDVLNVWKVNQLKFQKILLDFYHSFNTRVKFDNLIELYSKISNYIDVRDMLRGDETYNEVIAFVETCREFCGLIKNQLNDKVYSIADKLKAVLFDLSVGKSNNMLKDLRDIGYAIYRVSYMPGNEFFPSFPFILSPGGFLGNVLNGVNFNEDPLEKIINDLKAQRQNRQNAIMNQENAMGELLKNYEAYKLKVIANSVRNYLTKIKKQMDDNVLNNLVQEIYKKLAGDAITELNNVISAAVAKNGNVDNVIASENIVKNDVDKYFLSLEQERIRNVQRAQAIDQQIIDAKMRKAEEIQNVIIQDNDLYLSNEAILKKYRNDRKIGGVGGPLTKWYADIVKFSNAYDVNKGTLNSVPLNDLMSAYPIDSIVMDEIAIDYSIPNARESIYEYSPSNLKNTGKKYTKEKILAQMEEENVI